MGGYLFLIRPSALPFGTILVWLHLAVFGLAARDAMAAVQTSFTGTFALLAGSDTAGLNGATLEFITTTDEIWGSSPRNPSVPVLSATATVTGSAANDGTFSTLTANPYWVNEFLVTFDADLNSTSIDFALPDSDLLQVAVLTSRTNAPPSAGNPVVPENWGNVLFGSAITGESLPTSAGNLYRFTDISFTVTDLIDIDVRDAINLSSRGLLSVTVPSTGAFDAQQVDVDTLLFGDPALTGTHIAPSTSTLEDATEDGLTDLVLKFSIPYLVAAGALNESSLEVQLSGSTLGGTALLGSDTLSIVPLNAGAPVPEPAALALALASIPGLILIRRRKRTT